MVHPDHSVFVCNNNHTQGENSEPPGLWVVATGPYDCWSIPEGYAVLLIARRS